MRAISFNSSTVAHAGIVLSGFAGLDGLVLLTFLFCERCILPNSILFRSSVDGFRKGVVRFRIVLVGRPRSLRRKQGVVEDLLGVAFGN